MVDLIRTGGGSFEPNHNHVYFIAANIDRLKYGAQMHDYLLVAVNEINTDKDTQQVRDWVRSGKKVLIDSGIYNLAMEHSRIHGVSHNVSLNMAPHEIDGFDKLLAKYLALVKELGDTLWGYIELDQGGRENKIKTRAMLEAAGLRPIPVYHPLGDGWDYFEYLAERYDRICLGNIVKANAATRLRLLATIFERKKKYPNLWVHILGLTPNETTYAYHSDSADSSTWLSAIRWPTAGNDRACGQSTGSLHRGLQYVRGSENDGERGSRKAARMHAYIANLGVMNWQQYADGVGE